MERGHKPQLSLNVIANYVGKLWGIASVYAFVPLYVHILGIDAYGLIAFNAVVLGLLYVADAGLSAAFAREAAKSGPGQGLLDLLISIERVLFTILTLVGAVFMLAVPLIGSNWLNGTSRVTGEHIMQCLWLMGIAILPQIGMFLYFGGLMGLQRQVSANLLWIGFSVARSGLVVIPIYFIPDIRIFFVWQAIVAILTLFVMRATLLRHIIAPIQISPVESIRGNFSWSSLRAIRGYAAGMLGMSVIAALNTQIDKLVVSNFAPLREFSSYTLASTLAQVPIILTLPIGSALLPRLTEALQDSRRHSEILILYRSASYFIACVGSISSLSLFLFIEELFAIWLPGVPISSVTIMAGRILAIGSLLMTLQLAPYQLSLANGHQKTNLRLGAAMLLTTIPLQILLTYKFGVLGAAIPWLFLNFIGFVYLGNVLNKKFAPFKVSQWFLSYNIPPLIFATIWTTFGRIVADLLQVGALFSCVVAAAGALGAVVSSYAWYRWRV